MKKGFKVFGIFAVLIIISFSAAAAQETGGSDSEEINREEAAKVEKEVFVDNGERFISFDWSGSNDKTFSRKLTKDCTAEYIETDDNYTLMIYAKSDNADSTIQLLAVGTSDSNWGSRNFVLSVMLVGTTMMSVKSESITILDDGKESGLFRASFDGIYCIEKSFHTTLTNGMIQANVKK